MKNIKCKLMGIRCLLIVSFLLMACIQVTCLFSKNDVTNFFSNVLQPKIIVKPDSLNFKYIKKDSIKSIKIIIKNDGNSDLVITIMKIIKKESNNRCDFTISIVTFPRNITSGSTDTVVVEFKPLSEWSHEGTLQILSNDPMTDTLNISLVGYCVPGNYPQLDVKVQELNFGQVPTTTPKIEAIKVYNVGYTTVEITPNLALQNTPFRIIASPSTINTDESTYVKIRFAPEKEFTYTNSLILKHNSAFNKDIKIILYGSGILGDQPKIEIEPDTLNFGQVAVGDSKENTFKIKNTGTDTLKINSLVPQNPAFSIISPLDSSFSLKPDNSIDVIVKFKPSAKGKLNTTLKISSNDPLNATINYPLSGEGVLKPKIEVEPDILEFGDVNIDSNKNGTIFVYSRGSTPLTVDFIDVTIDDKIFTFSYLKLPISLDKNKSVKIEVTFAPTETKVYNDTLIINNNDRQIKIPLVGKGISSDGKLILSLINYPNPFHFGENTTIEFTLSQDTQAIVNIYDLSGQLVAKFKVEKTSTIQWDGLDYNNSRVAYGVYLCELIATGQGKEERRYRKIAITPK